MRGEAFARQLKLLALLEARPPGVELEEATEELGAHRRTVYRDFRVLECGFRTSTWIAPGTFDPPVLRPVSHSPCIPWAAPEGADVRSRV